MQMELVLFNGRAFAYAQSYEVHSWPQPHLDHLPVRSRAIDTFIGDPTMIGRCFEEHPIASAPTR